MDPEPTYESRVAALMQSAETVYATASSWVVFFRVVLGMDGLVRSTFPNRAERLRFESSPEFGSLLEMVAALRTLDRSRQSTHEAERQLVVRIPTSLHLLLCDEREETGISINKLVITKLLQPANTHFLPESTGRPKGRRPQRRKPQTEGVRRA